MKHSFKVYREKNHIFAFGTKLYLETLQGLTSTSRSPSTADVSLSNHEGFAEPTLDVIRLGMMPTNAFGICDSPRVD